MSDIRISAQGLPRPIEAHRYNPIQMSHSLVFEILPSADSRYRGNWLEHITASAARQSAAGNNIKYTGNTKSTHDKPHTDISKSEFRGRPVAPRDVPLAKLVLYPPGTSLLFYVASSVMIFSRPRLWMCCVN